MRARAPSAGGERQSRLIQKERTVDSFGLSNMNAHISFGEREKGVKVAIRNAWRKFSKRSASRVARASGADLLTATRLGLKLAGGEYIIDLARRQLRDRTGMPASDRRELLMLHYLAGAKELEPSGKMIGFGQIPEARSYEPVFKVRTVGRLVAAFGESPEKLVDAARPLGGVLGDAGDVSVVLNVFPRVPITIVMWRGDDEFPADGNILFDGTVTEHMPVEDIVVSCEEVVSALVSRGRA